MKFDESYIKRFEQLIDLGESFADDSFYEKNGQRKTLEKITVWITNCLNALEKVTGRTGVHYEKFVSHYNKYEKFSGDFDITYMLGVIKAVKDDYENGYLFDTRTLIEAEIFDDLLEQSEHLLSQGYFQASAVIAGCVLEDALRKLCIKNSITLSAKPKMESMNTELVKANVYNLLKQKQITAFADIRNKAAHNQGGFTKEDVEELIRNVRRFMEDYFS
jgi:hypothetical protein